jgi:hypothetical protein
MSFILLEIAMQPVTFRDTIHPDLSEAPENSQTGHPKCRTGAATGSKCKAQSRKPAGAQRQRPHNGAPDHEGSRLEEKIELTNFVWIDECPRCRIQGG